MSQEARTTIRKAIKSGITITQANDASSFASSFYELFVQMFARQNRNPPVTEDYFKDAIALLKSKHLGETWVAQVPGGEIAYAIIVTYDAHRAYGWTAATNVDFNGTGATSLAYFHIFEDLKRREIPEINMMSGNTLRLANFINQFNPTLVPYYSVEKASLTLEFVRNLRRLIRS
jgi:lipid II:glycine glycyltransferase (peptidoglycan interpeptide bridge formation enzyme)